MGIKGGSGYYWGGGMGFITGLLRWLQNVHLCCDILVNKIIEVFLTERKTGS